ncbi:MAG: amidohydrolase family protein [Vicinamibacteria bacterium]
MGLSWREILASLTTAPAARFGESDRRGRIAPGMDADLVLPRVRSRERRRSFRRRALYHPSGRGIFSSPAGR